MIILYWVGVDFPSLHEIRDVNWGQENVLHTIAFGTTLNIYSLYYIVHIFILLKKVQFGQYLNSKQAIFLNILLKGKCLLCTSVLVSSEYWVNVNEMFEKKLLCTL